MTYILVFPAKHELSSKRLRDPQPQKIGKFLWSPFFSLKDLQCRGSQFPAHHLFQYNWRKFVFLIPRADMAIAGTAE